LGPRFVHICGVAAAPSALFRTHPALAAVLPWHPLLSGPTPVARLVLPELPADTPDLWIKRDDRSCSRYGGNKPRKLEFILGAALARRSERLITTGGLGTHHGLATTILGSEAGMRTTLILVDQPLTREVQQSLLLHAAYGAKLVYGRNLPGAAAQLFRVLGTSTLRMERPTYVPTGGTSRHGNLGFVAAAFELAEQVEHGDCPEPADIYIAIGSGGSLIGLAAGLVLTGLRSRLVGVLVNDVLPPSPRRILGSAGSLIDWLASLDASISSRGRAHPDLDYVKDQLGPCYGAVTPAAREAMTLARQAGIQLETTYTAKCLAEIVVRARSGRLRGPSLFWNTYNGVDVVAQAPRPLDAAIIPPAFQRFLREPVDD